MLLRILFLTLLAATSLALAAQPDTVAFSSVVAADVRLGLGGAIHIFSAPVEWDSADWHRVIAAATITLGASALDMDMRTLMRRSTGSADGIATPARLYGEWHVALLATAGLYGTGLLLRDSWLRETAVLAGTALVVSGFTTGVAKRVIGRARPRMDYGHGTFHMFTLEDDYGSFPSGHTVAAFALSSVLAARIDHPVATVALYGAACLTALSRTYTDQHWLSDVVFGGILASAIGRSLVRWHEDRDSGDHALRIVPCPDRVVVIYSF